MRNITFFLLHARVFLHEERDIVGRFFVPPTEKSMGNNYTKVCGIKEESLMYLVFWLIAPVLMIKLVV